MPQEMGELDRSQYPDSFNQLLDLITREVEGPGRYYSDPQLSERSLSNDPILEYFPVAFFGYQEQPRPVSFRDEQGQERHDLGIAHVNISSVASGKGRKYDHELTVDGRVLRRVVRVDGPQLPVEQPRYLSDEAVRGLIRRLAV
jgi:hypothetical protein